jgi:hypothetical protein
MGCNIKSHKQKVHQNKIAKSHKTKTLKDIQPVKIRTETLHKKKKKPHGQPTTT